jgi:hypothetical protein
MSADTAVRLWERCRDQPGVRYECVQPVFAPWMFRDLRSCSLRARWMISLLPARLIDRMLPDKWSFVPQRAGYYRRRGFDRLGLPSFQNAGMEEFLWRGRPFGAHLRGMAKRFGGQEPGDYLPMIRKLLDETLLRLGYPPLGGAGGEPVHMYR